MKLNRSPGFGVILEQVRLARQQYGEHLKPAAEDADIDRLRHDCASIYGLRVPDGYCDFLRLSDGLNWDGAYFFGSRRLPCADDPSLTLSSVASRTAECWEWLHKLVVGAIEDQFFCYDEQADEYRAYRTCDVEPYRCFKTFDELFAYAFESRI